MMRRPSSHPAALILLALLLTGLPASLMGQPRSFPAEPGGHVSDFADFLTASETQRLETKLRNYRDSTTTVIAIATLQSLQGSSIEETATAMFNEWSMWEGERDNGVLVLASREERQLRIEVGYGLEGAIPDVMAGRIIRNILTPSFREGNYYEGFDRTTSALIQLASGEFEGDLTQSREGGSDDEGSGSLIVFLLFLAFVVYVSSRRGGGKGSGKGGKRRRTLGPGGFIFLGGGGFGGGGGGFGGGGGGGFGGFGGGGGFGSGGGGASGGW